MCIKCLFYLFLLDSSIKVRLISLTHVERFIIIIIFNSLNSPKTNSPVFSADLLFGVFILIRYRIYQEVLPLTSVT